MKRTLKGEDKMVLQYAVWSYSFLIKIGESIDSISFIDRVSRYYDVEQFKHKKCVDTIREYIKCVHRTTNGLQIEMK